ncbi:MAG: hypothetical protein JWQ97_1708 [Phenylobacterium sp.]|nr:hypothetical protein [Phenylobacterium sp.]
MNGQDNLGSPQGGGPQGEPVEGSLTDGGSLPGEGREDRSFGAGRKPHGPAAADDPAVTGATDGGDAAVSGVIVARKIFQGSGVIESGPGEAASTTGPGGRKDVPPR